jgi:hypothetical protein
VVAICAGLLAAGLAATAAAVYYVLSHDVPGMVEDRADTLKAALLVVGGSGALAGLYVAFRKQRTDEPNHLRDRDKVFTERYTAAVAQLGSPAAAVRLGGVHALARIADDSEPDRPTCLEALCAYLRLPYDPASPDTEPAERQVRTTAQTAIAARLRPGHPGFWVGARVDLTGAYLIDPYFDDITADFFHAVGATFGGPAFFSGATFNLTAGFAGATFSEAAQFTRATFNCDAVFSGAKFNQGAQFNEAAFSGGAGFDSATFIEDAWFDRATFSGSPVFGGATFIEGAWFDSATFSRDRPPVWPGGSAEPVGIVWDRLADPQTPVLGQGPDPAADLADPPSGP